MRYCAAAVILPLFVILASTQMLGRSRRARALPPCSAIKNDAAKLLRPSPPGCSDIKFSDGTMIVLQYGRPKLRNPINGGPREVFGTVVPWGKVWRAGANEATSFITDANLIIANKRVPAGAYTIYVIPERHKPWTFILNRTTGQPGYPYPGASSDLARIEMDTNVVRDGVDQLTIDFESSGSDFTQLTLKWEDWEATVNIVEEH
jgi:hypothetical protein